jgi:hypothetical protein
MTKAASHDTNAYVFHKVIGPALMALPDAHDATRRFPDQWSHDPWSDQPQDRGQFVHIASDWREFGAEQRRGIAAQIWRDMADRAMAEVDAALAGRFALRFNAAAKASR